ncbi:MAG TPA: Dabb family protein [Gemmatimonadales bacterium]|nr:Dabb family protein [Gemmatimonadales bacterium]
MVHHIVCFRFKEGTTAEKIAAAGDALMDMQRMIAEVRAVRWGPNLAPSAGEYSHVLTVELDDMGAVERYLDHPIHKRIIADHLAPIRDARLAIDVEV